MTEAAILVGVLMAPEADYTVDFFVTMVARFLDRLDIEDAVLVGEWQTSSSV